MLCFVFFKSKQSCKMSSPKDKGTWWPSVKSDSLLSCLLPVLCAWSAVSIMFLHADNGSYVLEEQLPHESLCGKLLHWQCLPHAFSVIAGLSCVHTGSTQCGFWNRLFVKYTCLCVGLEISPLPRFNFPFDLSWYWTRTKRIAPSRGQRLPGPQRLISLG